MICHNAHLCIVFHLCVIGPQVEQREKLRHPSIQSVTPSRAFWGTPMHIQVRADV